MTCIAICLIIRYNFSVTSVAVREDSDYTSHRPTAVSSQKHLFRLIIYLVFRPARESRAFLKGQTARRLTPLVVRLHCVSHVLLINSGVDLIGGAQLHGSHSLFFSAPYCFT